MDKFKSSKLLGAESYQESSQGASETTAITSNRLQEHIELLESTINTAQAGVLRTDAKQNILFYNKTIIEMLGLEKEHLETHGINYTDIYSFLSGPIRNRKDMLEVADLPIKYFYQPKSLILETIGGKILLCVSSAILDGEKIKGLVWTVSDITELKVQEKLAHHRSMHDPLTRLPNRTFFFDKLQRSIKNAARSETKLALLFIDIDNFKNINDNYGHNVGDQLLLSVAERIGHSLRLPDTFARLGGDEFVIILEQIKDKSSVEGILERIKDSFRDEFNLSGISFQTTISVGVAVYPDDALNARALLKQADNAMYHAKKLGKNTYCFYDEEHSIGRI